MRNMNKQWPKRIISIVLTVALLLTILPGTFLEKMGEANKVQASTSLSNPRIVEDSSMESGQKVTWDCVWFGSYPQTEIVDKPETCGTYGKQWGKNSDYEVNTSLYTQLKESTGWDDCGDITINNVKYRRVQKDDTLETEQAFHAYTEIEERLYDWNKSTNNYHYFRYEKIKWRVLKVEGDTIMLLADQVLDERRYNINSSSFWHKIWKSCTLRSWLNSYGEGENDSQIDYSDNQNGFLNTAFTSTEKGCICKTQLDNYNSGPYSRNCNEKTTEDKVFILAYHDLYGYYQGDVDTGRSIQYGFYDGKNNKQIEESLLSKSSTYAKSMGIHTSDSGNTHWMIRSLRPGNNGDSVYVAVSQGHIYYNAPVDSDDLGIRPSIIIDSSSSNLWSYAGTVSNDGTIDENGPSGTGGDHENNTTNNNPVFSLDKDKISINEDSDRTVTGRFYAGSIEKTNTQLRNIEWKSKSPTVAEIQSFTYSDSGEKVPISSIIIKIKAKRAGFTTIVGTTPDGLKVSLTVEVSASGQHEQSEYGLNLKWGKDNFSFENSEADIGVKAGKKYGDLENTIDKTSFDAIDKYKMKKELNVFGGVCFGMSTLTYQLYKKEIDVKVFQGYAKTPYELIKPAKNPKLKEGVGLNQIKVATSMYQEARNDFIENTAKTTKERLSVLVSKLKNIEKTKKPILIDYAWISDIEAYNADSNGEDGWSAHAVLAYALETEGAPYKWEGVDYAYRVRILDPNYIYAPNMDMNEANKTCLYITKDLRQCYTPVGETTSDGKNNYTLKTSLNKNEHYLGEMVIQFVTDDENLLPPKKSSDMQKYEVINTTGTFLYMDGVKINGPGTYNNNGIHGVAIQPSASMAGSRSNMVVFTDKTKHSFKVTTSNQRIDCTNNGLYQSVTASLDSSITLNGKEVDLQSEGGDYKVSLVSNSKIPSTVSNVFEIIGSGKENLFITVYDGGVEIEGDGLPGTTVTTEDGTKVTINNDNQVVVKESENRVTVIDERGHATYIDKNNKKSNPPNNKQNDENTSGDKGNNQDSEDNNSGSKGSTQVVNEINPISEPILVYSVNISAISHRIAVGKKIRMSASKILPMNATNKTIIWSSSNKKVATVTQSGLVKIKKKKTKGKTVKIIATAADGSGVKAVWKIKVMKGVVKSVGIKKAKSTLQAGKTMKLKGTVKATKGANKKLKWTSSNPKWATVSSKGVVKALNAGKGKTVKITAMATDGSGKKKTIKIKIKRRST